MRRALAMTILVGACERGPAVTFVEVPCAEPPARAGEATWYDADGTGACSFEPAAAPALVAALDDADYGDDAALCGACAEVDGPRGRVTVRIVDRCPGCKPGGLDLSAPAFARIADLDDGRVPIRWRVVPCHVEGPLRYRWKERSSPGWAALQVREHRHPIARLEARPEGGGWRALPRRIYNHFVAEGGLGDGAVDVRVTDSHGAALVDRIAFGDGVERVGAAQLPRCRRLGSEPPGDP